MNRREQVAAANALIQWFRSQDIQPADAGMVMSMVLATSMVDKTSDLNQLDKAAQLYNLMLLCDISDLVRA